MKIALILLGLCLAAGMTSCASRAPLPERPRIAVCVADEFGGAMCYEPKEDVLKPAPRSISGYVCFEPKDYALDEEWIYRILEVSRGI